MRLSVVAKGVENLESWNLLNEMGCYYIQGFYLSKPLATDDFENWLMDYESENTIMRIQHLFLPGKLQLYCIETTKIIVSCL